MKRLAFLAAFALIAAGAARAEDLRDLCPDRPLKGTSACTVDAGHWQVETDVVNFTHDTSGGITTDTLLAPNPTLKYGVSDTFDVEASLAPFEQVHTRGGGTTSTDSGIGDLYLRAKWHVAGTNGQDGAAIEPYIKLPTARDAIGNGAVEGGVIVPYQQSLPWGWSLDVTPEADLLKNQNGDRRHLSLSASAGFSHPITDALGIGLELWTQQDFDPSGTGRQYSFDLASTWQPKGAPFAFDAGVNLGLNSQTPDVQVYVGVSRRF